MKIKLTERQYEKLLREFTEVMVMCMPWKKCMDDPNGEDPQTKWFIGRLEYNENADGWFPYSKDSFNTYRTREEATQAYFDGLYSKDPIMEMRFDGKSTGLFSDEEDLYESKKKKKNKLCARGISAAKSKFDVYPSAYANGYAVQVCKGKIKGLDGNKKCSGSYCSGKTNESWSPELEQDLDSFHDIMVHEDLAVWFGTKKKSKGAKQPQGPWVNICRKKEGGGHPECGRSDSDKGGYPVCRAKSVAARMSQKDKDSACRRKREREKTDGKSGKGQSPSPIKIKGYKSKKNESLNYDRMLITENKTIISEGLRYHIEKQIPLTETIYRYGSESFFKLINEVRDLYEKGNIDLSYNDLEIIKTDIGKQGIYEGKKVWLDIPNEYIDLNEAEYKGKKVELSKPKRGGSKKFYVYVMCNGKVKKVSFGAKSGGGNLAVKLRDPKARKAFADRHNCPQKNDKCSAGYWSCRLPRYAKQLGLSGGGTWW